MLSRIAIYLFFSSVFVQDIKVIGGKFPSALQSCNKYDPNFEQCMIKSATQALEVLKNGFENPKLLSIDPLYIEALSLRNAGGSMNLQLSIKNLNIYNLSKSVFTELKVDFKNNTLTIKCRHKNLTAVGEYTINGHVLFLPVRGNGILTSTFDNMDSVHNIKYELYQKKDKKNYGNVTEWKVTYTTDKVQYQLTNLFNGDQRLSDEIHKLVNENWHVLEDDLNPAISQAIGLFFKAYVNRFCMKIPFEELFPVK